MSRERKKILFINPSSNEPSFWNYDHIVRKFLIGKKSATTPTGLATVAAMFPEEHFEILGIKDQNFEKVSDKDIKKADYIALTGINIQEKSFHELTRRAHNLETKVIAGGPFVTENPQKGQDVDYLILGEAELSLPPFIHDLLQGNPKQIYSEGDSSKPLLVQTPGPRWDLLDLKKYVTIAVQDSRGCPFKCEFCNMDYFYGRDTRAKEAKQLLAEIDFAYEQGHRGALFLTGENVIQNKNFEQFLGLFIEWQKHRGYPLSIFGQSDITLGTEKRKQVLEKMVEAGFTDVFIGLESIDKEVLKKMHKWQNVNVDLNKAIFNIQQAGLGVDVGLMFGYDGEKESVFEDTYEFIHNNGIVNAMAGLVTAVRGSDLYKRLKKEGRLLGESSANNTHHLGFNFVTERDERTIIEGYKSFMKKAYSPENYYQRCEILDSRRGERISPKRTNLRGFLALGRSLVEHPFTQGKPYTKRMAKAIFTNPKAVPELTMQAIKLEDNQKNLKNLS